MDILDGLDRYLGCGEGGGGCLIDRLISYWLYYIGVLSFFLSFFFSDPGRKRSP